MKKKRYVYEVGFLMERGERFAGKWLPGSVVADSVRTARMKARKLWRWTNPNTRLAGVAIMRRSGRMGRGR